MAYKIHVKGFSMVRTVEGVLNAYTVINPGCSLADINRAFPASIHHSGKPILGGLKDANAALKTKDISDDYIKININTTNGGKQSHTAYMLGMWSTEEMLKLVTYCKKADIEISDFKERKYFVPGSYTLEYMNGWKPGKKAPKPATGGRKAAKSFTWLFILLAILLCILLFFLFRHLSQQKEAVAENVEQVETEFNAVQFARAKADLSPSAKEVLDKLATLMLTYDKYTLRVEGHTSKEGDENFNMRLSENRAKATYDYLIYKGVPADRLEYEGLGSSKPIDTEHLAPNRRTEFILDDGKFTFRGLWEDLVKYLNQIF